MRMIVKSLFAGSGLLLMTVMTMFTGCKHDIQQQQGVYAHEVSELDLADESRELIEPRIVDIEPIGAHDLITIDNYLFFLTYDNGGQLKVYDIDSGREIASLCAKGRAANEFQAQLQLGARQIYRRNGEILLPLLDHETVKEVNITQSIAKRTTVINDTVSGIRSFYGDMLLIDNDLNKRFVFLKPRVSNSRITEGPKCYIQEPDKEKTDITVFNAMVQGDDDMSVYSQYLGGLYKHPDRNIMVKPVTNMNYLLFFDLDRNRQFAIHQKGTRSYDDMVITGENYDPTGGICFGDGAVSADVYYVIYLSNTSQEPDSPVKNEILKFDWEGKLLGGVKVAQPIHRIAYNESRKMLYALNLAEEKVYSIEF